MGRLLPLLVASWFVAARADALVVEQLKVQIDPARSDRYALAGRYDALALDGATAVVLRLGHLDLTVPAAGLVAKGKHLRYRGSRREPGIASLKIDPRARAFVAKGRGLVLSGLTGPLAVALGSDVGEECAIAALREASRRQGKRPTRRTLQLARSADGSACGLAVPAVSPGTLVGDVSETVTVSIAVPEPADAARVLEVDDEGRLAAVPLCQLADDGATAGDARAGDGLYACSFVVARPAPSVIRLAVEATVGGRRLLSPGVTVPVAAPLGASDVATFDAIQAAATTRWQRAVARFGDTRRARIETARALRRVRGVADASIGPGDASIEIACPGGIRCSMLLPCGAVDGAPTAAAMGHTAAEPSIPPAALLRSGIANLASNCSGNARRRPKDNRVLIWDPGTLAPTLNPTPFIEGLYRGATCPGLSVEVDREGSIESVGRFGSYGTVVIVTHGLPGAFSTSVEVNADQLALLAGGAPLPRGLRLVWGQGLFDHLTKKRLWAIDVDTSPPGTFGDLGGTIVYGAYCHSANPAAATLQHHGAGAFVGYTGAAELGFLQASTQSFVRNMLERYQTVATAVADASPRVGPVTGSALVARGDPALAYLGNATLAPALARVLPGARATFAARVEGVDAATSCDFTYRWKNDADHGHLRGGFLGGQDDFESPGTRVLAPSDEATYTAEPDDPGLDNLSVEIEPAGDRAGGTDFSRFGSCQGQVIVSGCGDGVVAAGEECDGGDDAGCPGRCTLDCRCAPPTPSTTTTTTLPGGGCTSDDECPTCQCCNQVTRTCTGTTGSGVIQCCNISGAPPTDITPTCGPKTPDVCPASATCPPPGQLLGGTYYFCAYCAGSLNIIESLVPSGSVPPISSPSNACTRR